MSQGLSANDYHHYDHRTHVYEKPDVYIGPAVPLRREDWVFNQGKQIIEKVPVIFPPGCERLFLEVLSNACDNVGESRRAKVDPGAIEVELSSDRITVTSYGLPIPVEVHPEKKIYVPEMIFGSLLTSSKYKVDRHGIGTNGIGAKAANIFSLHFSVTVCDHIRHLKYVQRWEKNMTICYPAMISSYPGKSSSVKVSYVMDFARFGYVQAEGYPAEAVALYHRHCIDASFTSKVTVKFNGAELSYHHIKDYARLYFGDKVDTAIIHYEWPADVAITKKKTGEQVAKDSSQVPLVEMLALDTPDNGHHVSFVNCMMTPDGGVHVNEAMKAVSAPALKIINEASLKRLTRSLKGKEITAADKKSNTVSLADVKSHLSLMLSVRVVNPTFASQTKTSLSSPTPKIKIEENEMKPLNQWALLDRLQADLEAKQFSKLGKHDGKMRKFVKLPKGVDANRAGHSDRHLCSLWITEGLSGVGYANALLAHYPGTRDYIGTFPMRGKGLNVMNALAEQLDKNNEINELKKMLGLCEGVNYGIPENFARLRYGSVMIMADSDLDGLHIIGLILLFFHCRFPSLLRRGYVMYYKTPTIRVFYQKKTIKFYSLRDYEEWQKANPNYESWKHKYYKGLGTSSRDEVADDYKTKRIVLCFYDDKAPENMQLAFDKNLTDERKAWILRYTPLTVEVVEKQPISTFINEEMILFSIANLQRAIPKLMDGFKESQRKVIYAAHLEWKIGSKRPNYTEMKVAQFSAFVAQKSTYHHGENNLNSVIINMAQSFTGSNNIPWFTSVGQFGCVDLRTPILLWSGKIVPAQEVTKKDQLVGDDGTVRNIERVVRGIDHMYRIYQEPEESYVVNSRHILTMAYSLQGQVSHTSSGWIVSFFNRDLLVCQEKLFTTEVEARQLGDSLREQLFDLQISDYMHLPQVVRSLFVSVPNRAAIAWPSRPVPGPAYLAGLTFLSGGEDDYLPYLYNDIGTRSLFLCGILRQQKQPWLLTGPVERLLQVHRLCRSLGLSSFVTEQGLYLREESAPGYPIRIQYEGVKEYVGWYLDGNERFLLGDFTVTHNTRYQLGKDAGAARYIFTQPEKIVSLILRKEDQPILKPMIDEGKPIEPEMYYPVIPMVLINGCQGIATGFSTTIVNYNPLHVIKWYQDRLQGKTPPELFPWYRGFKGQIEIIERSPTSNQVKVISTVGGQKKEQVMPDEPSFEVVHEEEDEQEPESEVIPPPVETRPLLSMRSLGRFQEVTEDKIKRTKGKGPKEKHYIVIDELPLGLAPYSYHKWLESMVEAKKITGFRDLSVDEKVHFEIYGYSGPVDHLHLRLTRLFPLSNMVLLDERNLPVRYDRVGDILEVFFSKRLPIYQERKNYMIGELEAEVNRLSNKIRFIRAVIDKQLLLINVKIAYIRATMEQLQIPFEIYEQSRTRNLSEDDIQELLKKIEEAEKELTRLRQTSPTQLWLSDLAELEQACYQLL